MKTMKTGTAAATLTGAAAATDTGPHTSTTGSVFLSFLHRRNMVLTSIFFLLKVPLPLRRWQAERRLRLLRRLQRPPGGPVHQLQGRLRLGPGEE